MEKHTGIPCIDGLYWYYAVNVSADAPEPVQIDQGRYGVGKFKGFNGRLQAWLRDGEYLVGPQRPPHIPRPEKGEAIDG
ncbi:hypothetical protein E4188_22505 (plasmid) [Aeromonas media]|uniref:Uncharacterized protein n=1 Tax=Aeromonas media TaxID=651 RepID=A0ABX6NZQ3_AERME|nr:hypothetical protein E4187_22815 [Aeromonas media]QJT41273.1 hypothetical protein E4188_22505 [Aeromonas media]